MMKFNTYIDNLSLQITVDTKEEQKSKLEEILAFIKEKNNLNIVYPDYKMDSKIKIRNKRNTISTVRTSAFYAGKDSNSIKIVKFYISIQFSGLKRYIKRLDKLSYDLLIGLTARMKLLGIEYSLTGLDIAVDVECQFRNMLVICTRQARRTEYYSLVEDQVYISTNYVEKIAKSKLKRVALRSYFYYKTKKEELDFPLSRWELKLNTKFFNGCSVDMDRIEKALDRYHILYFEDTKLKDSKINQYNEYEVVRDQEIKELKLEKHRVYADLNYISDFLNTIFNMDEALLSVDGIDV